MIAKILYQALYPLLEWRSRRQSDLYSQMVKMGLDFTSSVSAVRFYLARANMQVEDTLFTQIEDQDFIEIYDRFGVQIFRSFNLYYYSSFSEQELAHHRMDQLYDRPEFLNKLLFKVAYDILNKKQDIAYNFCPPHSVVEKKPNGLTVDIEYKFMAPVYDRETQQIVGVLVCEKLTPHASESLRPWPTV